MKNKRRLFGFLILFLFSFSSTAQDNLDINVLLKQLNKSPEKQKPNIYNKIAWYYHDSSYQMCEQYAEKALKLSQSLLDSYKKEGVDENQKLGVYVLEKEMAKANYYIAFTKLRNQDYNKSLNFNYLSLSIFNKLAKEYPDDIEIKQYTANLLNDIGFIYKSIGRYDEAIKNYKRAIEANKELGVLDELGVNYNNLGIVFEKTEQYQESVSNFNNALDIAKELNQEENIATQFNNIGQIFLAIGDNEKAIQNFNNALAISEKIEMSQSKKALFISNIGMAELQNGNINKAIESFSKAKDLYSDLDNKNELAKMMYNIGLAYKQAGDYQKMMPYYNEALQINRQLGYADSYAFNLVQIADAQMANKELDNAISNYEEAIVVYDKIIEVEKGFKRHYTAREEQKVYDKLIVAYLSNGQNQKALFAMELAKIKNFAANSASDFKSVLLPSLQQIQESLSESEIILDYEFLEKDRLTLFIITNKEFSTISLEKKDLIEDFYEIFMGIRNSKRSFFKSTPYGRAESRDEFNSILQYYRQLVMVEVPDEDALTKRLYLGKMLYKFLISPVEAQLNNKTKLFIINTGALQSIPFETLITGNEKYFLIEKSIAYLPSASNIKLVKTRNYDKLKKEILVLNANTNFEKNLKEIKDVVSENYSQNKEIEMQVSMAEEPLLNDEQIMFILKKINEYNEMDSSLLKVYKWLGYYYTNNTGQKVNDLNALSNEFSRSEMIDNINKAKLDELSSDNALQEYKYLHFAIPGIGYPEIPMLSTLVLHNQKGSDGLINVSKLSNLKIKANTVILPQFTTDSKKSYIGDGAVYVANALILAGANGVNITAWNSPDDSDYFMMSEIYRLMNKNSSLSYFDALTEVKRKMIRWEYDKTLSNPYYWAKFLYFGK